MSRLHADLLNTAHIDVLIGGRLRDRRGAMGLTRKQVGLELGVSASAATKMKDGARVPASRLWQFCGCYGLDVAGIFAGLPHDVGPISAAAFPGTAGEVKEEGARFVQPTDDPTVEAITAAAANLTVLERPLALAAVRGIGSKSLRKVSL